MLATLALTLGLAELTEEEFLRRLPYNDNPQGYSPFTCSKYTGYYCAFEDGSRTATGDDAPKFNAPEGMTMYNDGEDAIYVADSANYCIRKITDTEVTTYAGTCGDGKTSSEEMVLGVAYADAKFKWPFDIIAQGGDGDGLLMTAGNSLISLRDGNATLIYKDDVDKLKYLAVNKFSSTENIVYVGAKYRVLECDVVAKTCVTYLGSLEFENSFDGDFATARLGQVKGMDWTSETSLVIGTSVNGRADLRVAYTASNAFQGLNAVITWKANELPNAIGSVKYSAEFGIIISSQYGTDNGMGVTPTRFYNEIGADNPTLNTGIDAVDAVYVIGGGYDNKYNSIDTETLFMSTDSDGYGDQQCQIWQCSLATFAPTFVPTTMPTPGPTEVPTPGPTPGPTEGPSPSPTQSPTGYDCQVLAGNGTTGVANGDSATATFGNLITSMGLYGGTMMVVDYYSNCIRRVYMDDVNTGYVRGDVVTFAGNCMIGGGDQHSTDGIFAPSNHADDYDAGVVYRPDNVTLDKPFRMTWVNMHDPSNTPGSPPFLFTEKGERNPPGRIRLINQGAADVLSAAQVWNMTTLITCAELDAPYGGAWNSLCLGITLGYHNGQNPITNEAYPMGLKLFVSTDGGFIHMCDASRLSDSNFLSVDMSTCILYLGNHESAIIKWDEAESGSSASATWNDMTELRYSSKWGGLLVSTGHHGYIYLLNEFATNKGQQVFYHMTHAKIAAFDIAGDNGLLVGSLDPNMALHAPGPQDVGDLFSIVSGLYTAPRAVFVPDSGSSDFATYFSDVNQIMTCNAYTHHPTSSPTTLKPTTPEPTAQPTTGPSSQPTTDPTAEPTQTPTFQPTLWPNHETQTPTMEPTDHPAGPSPTDEPTAQPTAIPTADPSSEPTASPIPTAEPTAQPTAIPTDNPTGEFTLSPIPTANPTDMPSWTFNPTEQPVQPLNPPTPDPTVAPEASSGMATGTIIGIVLVTIVVLILIGAVVYKTMVGGATASAVATSEGGGATEMGTTSGDAAQRTDMI